MLFINMCQITRVINMYSEEQQQVENALIGGIYTFIACFTFGLWLFTLYVDTVFLIPVMALLLNLYFVYRALTTHSFKDVLYFLKKYRKYRTIHQYFQQCKKHKQRVSIIDWEIKLKRKRSEQPQRVFQKIELKDSATSPQKQLFFYRKMNLEVESDQMPRKTQKSKIQMTKQQSQLAKESYKNTVRELQKKGIKQNQLKYLSGILKNKYTLKVKQLLNKSEENLRAIKNVIEDNFEVKILQNKCKPDKLEPVHIDQAIKIINQQGRSRCLPWASRMKRDDDTRQVTNRLVELVDAQQKLDQLLFDQFQVSQKYREKISQKILFQLQGKQNEKQLLRALLGIHNEEVNDYKYKIGWEFMNIKGGLAAVKPQIYDNLHVNLKVSRLGVQNIYYTQPGEDNFWNLLGMAALLERFNL